MGIAYQGITIKLIGWLVWYDNISLQFRGPSIIQKVSMFIRKNAAFYEFVYYMYKEYLS
jgi:hypothetical protein